MTIISNLKRLTPYSYCKSTRSPFSNESWNQMKGKLHKKNTQKSRKMYIIVCSKNNICLKVNVFFIKTKQTETKYCSLVRMYVLLEALPNGKKKSHSLKVTRTVFQGSKSKFLMFWTKRRTQKHSHTMCQFFFRSTEILFHSRAQRV